MTYEPIPTSEEIKDAVKAEQAKLLSKDTNTALRQVIKTIRKLNGVFLEENEALRESNSQAFLALQDKKIVIAREYESHMGQMISRKNELQFADPAMKDKLQETQVEFKKITEENMKSLDRMRRCTEKLGNTIRTATLRAVQKDRGYSYGETGAITPTSSRKAISSGISETA